MSERLKNSGNTKGSLQAIYCDVSEESSILELFTSIKEQWGGVDVCVNNAGVAHMANRLVDGETDKWRNILDVSLRFCNTELQLVYSRH